MLFINHQRLSLTLVVSTLLTLAISSVDANNDFGHPNRRDHDSLKRLIKMRSPFPQNTIINLGANPMSASASVSASQSASVSSAASVSATSSAPSSTATSAAAQTTAQAQASDVAETSHAKSTVFQTASVDAAVEPTASISPSAAAATKTKSTMLTVLIAWKLGHSAKFDDRLAPIDWQPTTNDDGIVPAHRRANSRASSFNSSTTHDNGAGRGAGGYRSENGHDSIPDHDFTSVPANLAPVGGYADLARGPSPQPQMQEALGRGPSMNRGGYNDGLARGPSMNRPGYDTGVPLHHQAGYGQADAYDYNGDAVRF
ncbi:hypothetical protein B0H10DRAFT_2016467 [Mycena sp. CBHHK59/15]|nr:hypothetical protein B0H10DRAFT_2016467 [Mycena sp. CBHHK59/15]